MKCVAIAFLLASAPLLAQDNRPLPLPKKLFPWDGTTAPATMKFKPAPGVKLGSLRVVFDQTLLAAVKEAAGGTIAREGDGSESAASLCYSLSGMRIWVVSSSPDGVIFGVVAVPLAKGVAPDKRCPYLPESLRPVVFDHGVALGMPREQLTAKFGAPSRTRGNAHEYHFKEDFKITTQGQPEDCTLYNTLEVRSRKGVIDAIRASLNTDC